jgi:tetratricopeptide (TPR) repeat protein
MASALTSEETWKKNQQEAEAELAALEAKRKLLEARKALEAIEHPSPPTAPDPKKEALAAAEAADKLAQAEKSAAEARKAEAEAALAAAKLRIGEVPSSGLDGSVTTAEKAGVAEAALLSAKAIATAADLIVERLPAGTQQAPLTIVLYPEKDRPDFQALSTFRAQTTILRTAYQEAKAKYEELAAETKKAFHTKAAVPILTTAGLALDAVTKLLSYFKSDYTIGGIELTQEDSALVHALAGRIAKSDKFLEVILPGTYNATALSAPLSTIVQDLRELSQNRAEARSYVTLHSQRALSLTQQANVETDASKKAILLDQAKQSQDAEAHWRAVVELYESFFSKLTAADEKGVVPLTQAVRELTVFNAFLAGAKLLLVRVQTSGGSYYTRKNLWTFFGGVPIFHMGGVVVSFVLLDGSSGKVLDSEVIPVHGGFIKAARVKDELGVT